ncbi:MAG: hypothetical protein ACKO1M_09685 [Planctomycetota bacterium]
MRTRFEWSRHAFVRGIVLMGPLVGVVSCSRPSGPSRHELNGSVTWRGQPVPTGSIVFAPDPARGNGGPGATAEIVAGKYVTRSGQGTVGGPHVATITGYDGHPIARGQVMDPNGAPLFPPQRVEIDLPHAAATHDFSLPADR